MGHSDPPHSDDPSSDVTSDPRGLSGGHDESEPVHREWAHLRIIEEIGRGGFGRVYRAWDTTLAREVALKLVAIPELDPEAAAEVLEEGRMLARVRHPNVVTVYGALQIGQEFGLWMELVRGRSLADVVRKDGPFGPEEAAVVTLSVCRALAAVHAKNLVHRDVKAQNVMRESGGRILLMDFGAGWDAGMPDRESWGRAPGTPNYMAPEVIAGHRATPASDIYGVGVLMYFLVTGKHPFEGRTLAEIALGQGLRRRRLLADDRPDLPEEFIRLVDRALSIDPAERFQSAGALMQELTARGAWLRRADDEHTDAPRVTGEAPALSSQPVDRAQTLIDSRPVFTVPGTIVLTLLGALIVPATLGFLMSMAFDVTLGRTSEFSDESPLDWWVWGIRSLVAPVVYLTIAIVLKEPFVAGMRFVLYLVQSAWRALRASAPMVDRVARELSGTHAIRALQADRLRTRAQTIFAVQVLLLTVLVWRFADLVGAYMSRINDAAPQVLAPLAPEHLGRHVAYGLALDALILFGALAWMSLLRARVRARQRPIDTRAIGGLIVLGISVLLLTLPYRIIWHSEFERVEFEAMRCYRIGQRATDLLLYCPELEPARNKVVEASNPRLRRSDVVESIFTTPSSEE